MCPPPCSLRSFFVGILFSVRVHHRTRFFFLCRTWISFSSDIFHSSHVLLTPDVCCVCLRVVVSLHQWVRPSSTLPTPFPVWCVNASLGGRRTVGEGESQARIDEENPGEIVKEKEGKEGPLKGSNENLNLQLAGPDGAENGNGQPVSSPIKESQQQTNGGTTPDGKDTAV